MSIVRCEIISGMDDHQHIPIDVYSERFIDPIMVRCGFALITASAPKSRLTDLKGATNAA